MIWEYLVICVVACNLETHLLKDVKQMNDECVYTAKRVFAFSNANWHLDSPYRSYCGNDNLK